MKGRRKSALKLIDTFAGAGGMTLGFTKLCGNRFVPVWANDINAYAAETYNANFGDHCQVGDIEDLLKDPTTEIPEADIVIGGPPCQGFSLLNKNRAGDPRKRLWKSFLDLVELSGASVFVMENVRELLGSGEYLQIKTTAEALGFIVRSSVLCAADYGVAERRYRAFIVGCNFVDPELWFPPLKTHYDPSKEPAELSDDEFSSNPEPWKTVRDEISDLPKPKGTEIRDEPPPLDLHFGRKPTETSLQRYKAIPKEGMNRFDLQNRAPELTPDCWIRKTSGGTDLFGRLWWDKPAFTIRTEFFKPEKGRYLHPKQHRPITHREAARIQSFPDDFVFMGTKIEIAKQIGNAVPPKLAAAVAGSVVSIFDAKEAEECPIASLLMSAAG